MISSLLRMASITGFSSRLQRIRRHSTGGKPSGFLIADEHKGAPKCMAPELRAATYLPEEADIEMVMIDIEVQTMPVIVLWPNTGHASTRLNHSAVTVGTRYQRPTFGGPSISSIRGFMLPPRASVGVGRRKRAVVHHFRQDRFHGAAPEVPPRS